MNRTPQNAEWLLTQLPGLSPEDCLKLSELELETTSDLLKRTQTPEKLRRLAEKLQLSDRWVRKWVALAELSQLRSVGYQYCGLLLHSGVTSIQQLATMSTHVLHRQILRLQVTTTQRRDLCPHQGIVAQWIQEAQGMMRSRPNPR
jgi:hypothetical protein